MVIKIHHPGVIDGCQQQKGFEAAQVAGPRLRSPRHRPPPPSLMSDCQGESAGAGATSEHLTSHGMGRCTLGITDSVLQTDVLVATAVE